MPLEHLSQNQLVVRFFFIHVSSHPFLLSILVPIQSLFTKHFSSKDIVAAFTAKYSIPIGSCDLA